MRGMLNLQPAGRVCHAELTGRSLMHGMLDLQPVGHPCQSEMRWSQQMRTVQTGLEQLWQAFEEVLGQRVEAQQAQR